MNNNHIKTELKQKLQEQEGILISATEDANTIRRPHCRDLWEFAEETERAVIIDNTLQQTQQNIEQIKNALFKLENNNYGYCEGCGDDIAIERLTILPEAEYCRICREST